MSGRRWRTAAVLATIGAVMATACTRGGDDDAEARRAAASEAAVTYVAVGASETAGIGTDDPLNEAWPKVLFRTALPRSTVYVNLGIPGVTAAEALARELPDALELAPTVATVWLNVNDIISLVSPNAYERDLRAIVRGLRQGGRTTVLVANTPALDRLPAYLACVAGAPAGPVGCEQGRTLPGPAVVQGIVAAYNTVIERVVREEGAVLVDLHATSLTARQDGTEAGLVSGDGFHPSTAGHQVVADAFAAALGTVPR